MWTHTSDYRGQIEHALTGSTYPRLSRKSLREMWVPVPTKDQQARLVAVAGAADAALIEARRTVEELEQLRSKQLDLDLYRLLEGKA